MPNTPLILAAATTVDPLVLLVDGFPSETHRLTTRTGGEPLENGREVTDHAVAAPAELVLDGVVSDLGGRQRPGEAWAAIREMHRDSIVTRVVTEWGTYPEMLITRAEGRPMGRGIRFALEVREILRVGTTAATVALAAVAPTMDRLPELARGLTPTPAVHPLPGGRGDPITPRLAGLGTPPPSGAPSSRLMAFGLSEDEASLFGL